MTTLELTQATAMVIDQAISLIISENKIDEAIVKLNEAKICTEALEKMINPPLPAVIPAKPFKKEICKKFDVSEDLLFTKTRRREICNARQVYMYVLMNTYIKGHVTPGPSRMKSHTGWDHATCIYACKVVRNYMDTERLFRDKVIELQVNLRNGVIAYPEIHKYVGWK